MIAICNLPSISIFFRANDRNLVFLSPYLDARQVEGCDPLLPVPGDVTEKFMAILRQVLWIETSRLRAGSPCTTWQSRAPRPPCRRCSAGSPSPPGLPFVDKKYFVCLNIFVGFPSPAPARPSRACGHRSRALVIKCLSTFMFKIETLTKKACQETKDTHDLHTSEVIYLAALFCITLTCCVSKEVSQGTEHLCPDNLQIRAPSWVKPASEPLITRLASEGTIILTGLLIGLNQRQATKYSLGFGLSGGNSPNMCGFKFNYVMSLSINLLLFQ